MDDLQNVIRNFLGKTSHVDFFLPFENNQDYSYNKNFNIQETKFTFGVQSDSSLRSGLEVESQLTVPIRIYSSFSGQLFFSPSPTTEYDLSSLTLVLLPNIALSLKLTIQGEAISPYEINYCPVDKSKIKEAMKKHLENKGVSGVNDTLDSFLKGRTGLFIDVGQPLGEVAGSRGRCEFRGSNGELIHPLYLLFRWYKLGLIKDMNHKLINDLKLKSVNLLFEEGWIADTQVATKVNLGPCWFWPIREVKT